MTNLKGDILKFSSNWETYLDKCQINGGNKTDEETYKLFLQHLQNVLVCLLHIIYQGILF